MAHSIRILWIVSVMLFGLIAGQVYADIIKMPMGGLFLEGTDVRLTCIVNNNEYVVWEEISEETAIFIGKKKNTENKKYDNFEISSEEDNFTLTIKNASLSDEGLYICKDGDHHASANVTIAVLPQLDVSMSQMDAYVGTKDVTITCSTYNGKPPVSRFEIIVDQNQPVNITNMEITQDDQYMKTFNSSATLPYQLKSNKIEVVCRVFIAERKLNYTEEFISPECIALKTDSEFRCQCTANPPVDEYHFLVDGNYHEGHVLDVSNIVDTTDVVCYGQNVIGTGRSEALSMVSQIGKNFRWPIVVVAVIVVITIVAIIVFRFLKSRSRSDGKEDNEMERGLKHEESSLLQDHQGMETCTSDKAWGSDENHDDNNSNEHIPPISASTEHANPDELHGPEKFLNELGNVFPVDWEIWAIDEGGLTMEETKTIIDQNKTHADQVKECLRQWISKTGLTEMSSICEDMKKMSFWKKHNYQDVIDLLDRIIASENNSVETTLCAVTSERRNHDDEEQNEVTSIDEDVERIRKKLKTLAGKKMKKDDLKDTNKFLNVLVQMLKERSIDKEDIKTVIREEESIFLHKLSQTQKIRLARMIWLVNETKNELSFCDVPGDTFLESEMSVTQLKFSLAALKFLEILTLYSELLLLLKFITGLETDHRESNWVKWIATLSRELTSTLNFHIMLDNVGEKIGRAGALRLSKEFTIQGNNQRFNESHTPGSDIVTYLRGSGQIKKRDDSVIEFANSLDRCGLFRATGIALLYIEKEFDQLCSQISVALPCDWELFAIDDLTLEKDAIFNIIDTHTKVESQITAALQLWNDKVQSKKKTSDLIKIMSDSKVCCDIKCNHCQELLPEIQSEGTLDVDETVQVPACKEGDFLPTEEYINLMETIGGQIGQTGAAKLLEMYNDDANKHKGIFGKSLLQYLSKSYFLGNTKPYLEDLKTHLYNCYLYRAGKAVEESISAQSSRSESRMKNDCSLNNGNEKNPDTRHVNKVTQTRKRGRQINNRKLTYVEIDHLLTACQTIRPSNSVSEYAQIIR